MQVGLTRHFKIPYRKWQWMNSTGYADFLRWYDGSEGHERSSCFPREWWHRCYSSDMLRARETALQYAEVPPTFMPLLREVPLAPPFDTRLKMPLVVWHVLSRIAWWFNHPSQLEGRNDALRRATRVVDFLRRQPADQNVLIVTHGFLMYVLRDELERAGFVGHIPTHPQCGEVYLFQGPTESTAPAPQASYHQPSTTPSTAHST